MVFYSQETNEKALRGGGQDETHRLLGTRLCVSVDELQVVVLAVLGGIGVGFDAEKEPRRASIKSIFVNVSYTGRDGDTSQTLAIMECTVTDASNAIWNDNAGQAFTNGESTITDASNAIRDGDAG